MSSFSGPEFARPMNLKVCSSDKQLLTNVWPWMTVRKIVQITVIFFSAAAVARFTDGLCADG